ncbi:MAG: substrate-binding domain-containing protein [Planctomycetota bacterium]
MSGQRFLTWIVVAAVCVAGGYFTRGLLTSEENSTQESRSSGPPQLDFIVGGPDDFWRLTIAGAKDAAKEFGAELNVHIPGGSPEEQLTALTQVSAKPSDGIAISPIAPDDESLVISRLASKAHVVTFDNDAPQSLRHCYVGTNNYEAGRLCAKAVRQALPDGGQVAVFIGDDERNNARERRRGFYDELLGLRSTQEVGAYPPNEQIEGNGFTIVKTYLDGQNPEKAEENAKQALEEHPDLNVVVGLYGYNGPRCLKAVRAAEKIGDVKIIAFDEHEETLQGIADGDIDATIIQDPYEYGYESIRLLVTLHKRTETAVPLGGTGTVFLPCRVVEQDTVADYREKLAQRINQVK